MPNKNPLKLKLSVFLLKRDPSWISLLDAEGISWAQLNSNDLIKNHTALVFVLPKGTPKSIAENCYALALRGACLICEPDTEPVMPLDEIYYYKMPYEDQNFCGLENKNNPQAIRVKRGKFGQGTVFCLPFCLRPLWESWGRARRFINVGNGQTIYEEMSAIVKKNVRRVVIEIIKQAFFQSGVPYIHKWYFPGRNRSVFCFRGDADGGPKENFLRWLDAVKPYAENTSVFFCTSQYQTKKELIRASCDAGLEVGSHNHWHIVFPERFTNLISLRKAEDIFKSQNIVPRGFVAPAYFWHPSMYKLLEEKNYLYSSSFRINHDGFPYLPCINGRLGKVLEIPFHCLGDRFPVSGIPLGGSDVYRFFKEIITKKYAAAEPMFFYGHPDVEGRMGTTPELVRFIMETARSFSDVKPMQLSEYARWWHRRNRFKPKCVYDSKYSELYFSKKSFDGNEGQDIMLRVEFSDGTTYLIDPFKSLDNGKTEKIVFNAIQPSNGDDIGEVVYRGSDPKASLFSWQTRKKIGRFLRAYKKVYL